MSQTLSSSISPLDTATMSSSKTHYSNLHLSLIFLMFLFLMIFLGKITLFLFLKQTSKRLGVLRSLQHFFNPISQHYMGVVRTCMEFASHIWGGSTYTAFLEKGESRVFVSPTLLILLTLSNLYLPVELLHHPFFTIAITTDTALLNSLVAYLLH